MQGKLRAHIAPASLVPSSSPNYKDMSGLHRWALVQEVEAHVVEELLGAAIESHSIL